MWYLILQIILCLLLAFILGYLFAKLLKSGSWKDAYEELKDKIKNIDNNLSSKTNLLENKLSADTEKIENNLKAEIASLKDEYNPKFKEHESMFSTLEGTLLSNISKNIDVKFADFESNFANLKKEIEELNDKLKNSPKPKYYDDDLANLQSKLDELKKLIDEKPEAKFYDDDISNINSGLTELQSMLSNIPTPKYYDNEVNELNTSIAELKNLISSKPDKDYGEEINNIWAQFTELKNSLNSLPKPKEYDAEINKLEDEISKLRAMLNDLPKPKYYDDDITKQKSSIDELSRNFASYYVKEDVDAKLKAYFDKWETELKNKDQIIASLEKRIEELEKKPKPAPVIRRPDDLKRISGVGKVLEKLLHKNGITTFKQVALFTDEQIDNLAEQLGSFHKRIRRDNWMAQAKELHKMDYGEIL